MYQAAMQRALGELDVPALRAVWRHAMPNMPQPQDDEETLIVAHMTRTKLETLRFKLRAYSHAWLHERSLPSQLPDRLKPAAQRMYPQVFESVGISVNSRGILKPVAKLVQTSMEDAVKDVYAEGRGKDQALVRKRMMEARVRTIDRLLGIKPDDR